MKRMLAVLILAGCASNLAVIPYAPHRLSGVTAQDVTRLIRTSRLAQQPDKIEVDPSYLTLFFVGESGIHKETLVFAKVASFTLMKRTDREGADRIVDLLDARGAILFQYYAVDETSAQKFIDVMMTLIETEASQLQPPPAGSNSL